jgi:hypothetical protein
MTTPKKIFSILGVIVLLIAVCALFISAPKPIPQIALSSVGVSPSLNSNVLTVKISNPSSAAMVYYIGNPVLKSNGVWGTLQLPNSQRLLQLGAGQSTTNFVTNPLSGEVKVPVLWGFMYTPRATKWQQLADDIAAFFRQHDLRGSGALYTNYSTGIKL